MTEILDFFKQPEVLSTIGVILAVLGGVLKIFGGKLRIWINEKIIKPLTALIKELAPTVISAVNQEFVDSLKNAGKWCDEYYHDAMELAYKKMQAMLTKGQWSLLEKVIGKDEVREFIKTIINDTIRELKTKSNYVNSKQVLPATRR